jgi:nitroimidazol reductase NimA-like FMN-containing flavoprotein (pyridoxamine 5'-phosphate oxidase superfamily)
MDKSAMQELTALECVDLLAACSVGRIGVIVEGEPIVLPVNYRWVPDQRTPVLAVRTRPGNVIDRAGSRVAFEIDGVDAFHHSGWSVLVRGTLHHLGHAAPLRDLIDPHPWLATDRDSWLVIVPRVITGRRLEPAEAEWAFHIRGYV